MNSLSEEQLGKISRIVREVEKLSDIEKLFLYLQLPCGRAEVPEGSKYKTNGNKCGDIFAKKPDQETTQTYTWILSHLEEDPNVSLPKQEVYDEYRAFCQANRFEPLCVADFGKAMKHAFPCIKPRRLGQRGNSRYCYSGLRKKYRFESPSVPCLISCHLDNNNPASATNLLPNSNAQPSKQQQHASTCCTVVKQEPHTIQEHQPNQLGGFVDTNIRPHEAINLKLEHSNLAVQSQHHQSQHQRQHSMQGNENERSDYSSGNSSDASTRSQVAHDRGHHLSHAEVDITHTNHHQLQQLCHNSGQQHLNLTNSGHRGNSNQSYHQLTTAHSMQNNYHLQQQQNRIGTPPLSATQQTAQMQVQYHLLQRAGTPDDDDYRHNYQDLDRPLVSTMQFSSAQSTGYMRSTFCDYLTPSCCPSVDNQFEAASPAQHNQISTSHHQQQQQQQHSPSFEFEQRAQQNCAQNECEHRQTMLIPQQGQQHRTGAPHTHVAQTLRPLPMRLQLASDVSHASHLCASPFQSPASTPYPMIGSNGSVTSSSGGNQARSSPYLLSPVNPHQQKQQPPPAHTPQPQISYCQPAHHNSPPMTQLGPPTINTVAVIATAGDCLQYAE